MRIGLVNRVTPNIFLALTAIIGKREELGCDERD
jgi:hypothetical protein